MNDGISNSIACTCNTERRFQPDELKEFLGSNACYACYRSEHDHLIIGPETVAHYNIMRYGVAQRYHGCAADGRSGANDGAQQLRTYTHIMLADLYTHVYARRATWILR